MSVQQGHLVKLWTSGTGLQQKWGQLGILGGRISNVGSLRPREVGRDGEDKVEEQEEGSGVACVCM